MTVAIDPGPGVHVDPVRLFRSADSVLWRYAALKQRLEAPRSADSRMDIGLMPVRVCGHAKCRRCRRRRRRQCSSTVTSTDRDLNLVCACCGRLWAWEMGHRLANEYSSGTYGGTRDTGLVELATLERIISRTRLWERRAWIAYVLGDAGGYRETADECRRRWPRAPIVWTKDRTRQLVLLARGRVERHLAWAGLLEQREEEARAA